MHRVVPIGRQLSGKLADPIASIRANNATNCTKDRFCNDPRRSIDFSRGQALRRRAMARTRTWTAAIEVERQRTCELAKSGNNLNQIARWANTCKENAEAVEVVAYLVAIDREPVTLAVLGEPR